MLSILLKKYNLFFFSGHKSPVSADGDWSISQWSPGSSENPLTPIHMTGSLSHVTKHSIFIGPYYHVTISAPLIGQTVLTLYGLWKNHCVHMLVAILLVTFTRLTLWKSFLKTCCLFKKQHFSKNSIKIPLMLELTLFKSTKYVTVISKTGTKNL